MEEQANPADDRSNPSPSARHSERARESGARGADRQPELYDAFISYRWGADDRLPYADALYRGLQKLARPWYRRRALTIVRDKRVLGADADLWNGIRAALAKSRYLIFLCSSEAADAEGGPEREAEIWWELYASWDHVLFVTINGELAVDRRVGTIDWTKTTNLPPAFRRHPLTGVPKYVDLSWARTAADLDLRHSRFRDAVLELAVPLHGKPKNDLDGEDVQRHRRAVQLLWAAVIALTGLSALLAVATVNAVAQWSRAVAGQLVADATLQLTRDPELSRLLAIEAVQVAPIPAADLALRSALLAHRPLLHVTQSDWVSGLAVSRTADRVAAAAADKNVIYLNRRSGDSRVDVRQLAGRGWKVDLSADGTRLLTSGTFDLEPPPQLWTLPDGSPHDLTGHHDEVWHVAFDREAQQAVIVSQDGTARVWDVATATMKCLISSRDSAPLYHATFNPNGTHLVVSGGDGGSVWDVRGCGLISRLEGQLPPFPSLRFSNDGQWIVGPSADNWALMWNASTGALRQRFGPHAAEVKSVELSPDDQSLVTASQDGLVRIFAVTAPEAPLILFGHTAWVEIAKFSPDGRAVVSGGGDHVVYLWDAHTGRRLSEFRGHTGPITAIEFAAATNIIVTASQDRSVRVWDAARAQRDTVLSGHTRWLTSAEFSVDGTVVATSSWDGTCRVWDARSGALQQKIIVAEPAHATALNREASILGCLDNRGILSTWDTKANGLLTATAPEWGIVRRFRFSKSGRTMLLAVSSHLIVSPDTQRTVGHSVAKIWNPRTGVVEKEFVGHDSGINDARFDADERRVVTASNDKTVRIWDAATGESLARLSHPARVLSAAFSPDGRRVVTVTSNNELRVWTLGSKGDPPPLKDARPPIDFSPDGSMLMSLDSTGTRVHLRRPDTGALVVEIVGHEKSITRASFSPDSNWIATAGEDELAHIWEARTGALVESITAHKPPPYSPGYRITPTQSSAFVRVVAAHFGPDSQSIVTAAYDNTARIHHCEVCLPSRILLKEAQAAAQGGRQLTSKEREIYLGPWHGWLTGTVAVLRWLGLQP